MDKRGPPYRTNGRGKHDGSIMAVTTSQDVWQMLGNGRPSIPRQGCFTRFSFVSTALARVIVANRQSPGKHAVLLEESLMRKVRVLSILAVLAATISLTAPSLAHAQAKKLTAVASITIIQD